MGGEQAQRDHTWSQIRLAVRGIEFRGRHGVHPEERARGHRFTVDVELVGDFQSAAQTDRLEGTVDYERVVALVRDINASRQYNLIESLACAIGDAMVESFPEVAEAYIRVRKHAPMLLPDVAATEAQVIRRRS
jgi:dihydroneopterin aldolase